jgi:hypothetical protein
MKEKSRKSSKSKSSGLEDGMDAVEIEESEKKERKRPSKKADGNKLSTSKSRRKPSRAKSNTGDPDQKGFKKGNSFRTMFNRKQNQE